METCWAKKIHEEFKIRIHKNVGSLSYDFLRFVLIPLIIVSYVLLEHDCVDFGGNYISFTIAAALIGLHLPGVKTYRA